MKNALFVLALAACSFSATAQPSAAKAPAAAMVAPAGYTEMMAATIAELNSTGDPARLLEIASKFERAAAAAPTDWLPQYYQAYGRTLASFTSKEEGDVKDKYLDQAEASLAQARKLGGDESELLALQGYLFQARLMIDPMNRAQVYSGRAMEAASKAKALNPANPRAYLVLGNNLYFMPEMYGGGKAAAKPQYEEAKARFAAFKPANSLVPNWGERQITSRLASYGASPAQATTK
jgi:hypothetical protein